MQLQRNARKTIVRQETPASFCIFLPRPRIRNSSAALSPLSVLRDRRPPNPTTKSQKRQNRLMLGDVKI